METWNRLITVGGEERGGNRRRKRKGLVKEYMNDSWTTERELTVGDRGGLGRGRQKGEINWDDCNRISNKKRNKE